MEDITALRIKERRLELGLTQEELAIMSGYQGRSSINKIERDTRNMPMEKVKLIAEALRVSPAYLMGWDDDPSASDGGRQGKISEIERLFSLLEPDSKSIVMRIVKSLADKDAAIREAEE